MITLDKNHQIIEINAEALRQQYASQSSELVLQLDFLLDDWQHRLSELQRIETVTGADRYQIRLGLSPHEFYLFFDDYTESIWIESVIPDAIIALETLHEKLIPLTSTQATQ